MLQMSNTNDPLIIIINNNWKFGVTFHLKQSCLPRLKAKVRFLAPDALKLRRVQVWS